MENSATLHPRLPRTRPLVSCEVRARLAFERGHLSKSAYESLVGITAEALRTLPAEECRAGEASSEKGEAARQKQIRLCDTPSAEYFSIHDEGEVRRKHQLSDHFSMKVSSLPSSMITSISDHADDNRCQLEMMEEQGFGLAARAARFWTHERNGAIESTDTLGEEEQDQRLLHFVDICLQAYPPSSDPVKTPDTTESCDFIWQNRLGLVLPSSPKSFNEDGNQLKNTHWEVQRQEESFHTKPTRRHEEKLSEESSTKNVMKQDVKADPVMCPALPPTPASTDPNPLLSNKNKTTFQSKDRFPTDKIERKRAMNRERKARWRAKQPQAKLAKERERARKAMALRRTNASETEKEAMRAVARNSMRLYREKQSESDREKAKKREAARKMRVREREREAHEARKRHLDMEGIRRKDQK